MTKSSSSRIKVRLAVVLLLGVCLTSCATSSNRAQAATKSPPPAAPAKIQTVGPNWVKVSSHPPTWYPRGTPADTPTDFRSGEWVSIDDDQGTRFFIPLHVTGPIPRQSLVNEALTARSPRQKVKIARENCVDRLNAIGNLVVGTPLTMMAMYGAVATILKNPRTSPRSSSIVFFGATT